MAPQTIDSLDKDSLKLLVVSLLKQNEQLLDQIKSLNARIAELEGRKGPPPKSPTNSSLPPSRGQKAMRRPVIPSAARAAPALHASCARTPM